jgi:uncharacterized protein YlxP (DUF503 family)
LLFGVEQDMPTYVGVATLDMALPATQSLKDKRAIVRSGIATVQNRFKVAAAEVGALGTFRRAEVAIAAVGNNRASLESLLDGAVRHLERDPRWILEGVSVEFL